MAWFKVDDKLHSSKKLLRIPRRYRLSALGLWTIAGSWSADQLTDGHVPDYMIEEWGGNKTLVDWLVKVELWLEVPEGTAFKNWGEYQPTKADIEAERDKNREKLRKWRERNRVTDGDVTGLQDGSKPGSNPAPDPTRPDPTHIEEANASSKPRKRSPRATRIPEGWTPADDLAHAMSIECPTVNQQAEHRKFVDYWAAKSGKDATKADWNATYRNWIRRAAETAPQQNLSSSDRRLQHGLGVVQRAGRMTAQPNPFEGRELTT